MKCGPIAVCALLLCGGCLEFDAQDITVRYDAKADRIDALLVYRGLFAESGNGSGDKPLDKAIKDLADARQTGEFVFWNNWPLRVDLTNERPAPVMALMAHIDVENGGLFTDPHGVLCAYQFVRVREARAFLQKVNLLFEVGLQARLASGWNAYGPAHTFDDDTKDMVREFLRSGEKLLTLEPGRLEVRLPCSAKDHAWLKGQLEQHFVLNAPREMLRRAATAARRSGGGDVTDTSVAEGAVDLRGGELRDAVRQCPSVRFFWDNDWSLQRDPELTTVGLGVRGAAELCVHKASEGLYHDSLLKALREKGETIEDGLPEQELARRFEAFRGRDAVLPPKLAERRGAGAPPAAKQGDK
ncbi:MAG TPA: hypothetical protein VFZ65_04270 [Planctomycetota bacterium]|nr:hypothetical protein [Planctomycetota bacterium]